MTSALRYDTIGEFNVDSKAECDQLNVEDETKTNKKAVLSQRRPRDARYISRSRAVAEIWPFAIL